MAHVADGEQRDADASGGRASIGQLVGALAENVSTLVRDEMALAKSELQESLRRSAKAGALLGVAAVLGLVVFLLVTWALAYGLADGTDLPLWATFLIVAGAYLVIAAILAFAGKRQLERARGPQAATREASTTRRILQRLRPPSHSGTPTATP